MSTRLDRVCVRRVQLERTARLLASRLLAQLCVWTARFRPTPAAQAKRSAKRAILVRSCWHVAFLIVWCCRLLLSHQWPKRVFDLCSWVLFWIQERNPRSDWLLVVSAWHLQRAGSGILLQNLPCTLCCSDNDVILPILFVGCRWAITTLAIATQPVIRVLQEHFRIRSARRVASAALYGCCVLVVLMFAGRLARSISCSASRSATCAQYACGFNVLI